MSFRKALKKIGRKAMKYGTMGMVNPGAKADASAGAPSGVTQVAMRDVARQRAAGAGTINYTEQV